MDRLEAAVPPQRRAPAASAELLARVEVLGPGSARVSVFDLQMESEAGSRDITLPEGSCGALGEAVALVISVMVEAGRTWQRAAPEPPPPPPEPPPEARPEPPPTPEREPEPTPAREPQRFARPERHAWQGPPIGHDLALTVATSAGLLPEWALGLTLGWGIRGEHMWPVWITASGWLPQQSQNGRGKFGVAYATLATCPAHGETPAWRWRLCPGIAVGSVWASGRALPNANNKVVLLTMGSLAGGIHVTLVGPLELMLEARLEVPIGRTRFVYYKKDGTTPQIHETKPVVGSFFGGLALRFR